VQVIAGITQDANLDPSSAIEVWVIVPQSFGKASGVSPVIVK